MKDIGDIIVEYLQANGFDGLCNGDNECGCGLVDLFACGSADAGCAPAYKRIVPCGDCPDDTCGQRDCKPGSAYYCAIRTKDRVAQEANPPDATDVHDAPAPSVILRVVRERIQQDWKWGEQNHHPFAWLSIAAEEFGEMAKEINDWQWKLDGNQAARMERAMTEAIQTAAVLCAFVENMERNKQEDTTCPKT